MKPKYVIIDTFIVLLFIALVAWIVRLEVANQKLKAANYHVRQTYEVARGTNQFKKNRKVELEAIYAMTQRKPAPIGLLAGIRQQENGITREYGVTAIMPGCAKEQNEQLASAAYIIEEVMTSMVTEPKYMDAFMDRLVRRWNPNNGEGNAHEIWKDNVKKFWIEYQQSIDDSRYVEKEKGLNAVRRKR